VHGARHVFPVYHSLLLTLSISPPPSLSFSSDRGSYNNYSIFNQIHFANYVANINIANDLYYMDWPIMRLIGETHLTT